MSNTIHFHLETKLSPAVVLAGLTDFGPQRAEVWPNVDSAHFQLHSEGPGWAEVTEGSSIAGGVWERERYTWDASAGTVRAETIGSNTWATGSRWDYKLVSSGGGTRIEVTVVRNPLSLKGRLIAVGLAAFGPAMLRAQMKQAVARMSPQ